ncbi:MAG: hypothetical protein ABIJ21_00920 [Nanoarchaeota archaeon]
MMGLFSLREAEIFQTLKDIKSCEFVVIGGYAVNAYTLPRFSIDCDIVIRDNDDLKKIIKILEKRGYVQSTSPALDQYSGQFCHLETVLENKFQVSMDILIGSVTDRLTGSAFLANWVFEHSKIHPLRGKTIREELKLRIINRDALLVMKMISARQTDIRDVFMMFPQAENKEWIREEIQKRYDIQDRMEKILHVVNAKQFKDGLSGVYGMVNLPTFQKHQKALQSFLDCK